MQRLWLIFCLSTVMLSVSVLNPGVAAGIARPNPAWFVHFADATCELPDGTQGFLQSDGRTCCPPGSVTDDTSCLYAKYINPLIKLLAAAVGVVVVTAIVYGAIEYITSGGDPKRVESGKKRITNALIGLAAFILLYAFLQFILPGGLASGQ